MRTSKNKIRNRFKILEILTGVVLIFFVFIIPSLSFAYTNPCAGLSNKDQQICLACHPEAQTNTGALLTDPSKQTPAGEKLSPAQLKSCQNCNFKSSTPSTAQLNNCLHTNPIIKDIKTVINFLSAGAGIIIVGSIIVGGIQYAIAGNNPNQVSAAKKRIVDSLIALVIFFLIYAFMDFIIPGGLVPGTY